MHCAYFEGGRTDQRRRKVYKIGGALKAGIIKFMNSKRAFVHNIPFVCRGREEYELPNHYNLSVLLAFGIQLTINRDSLRSTLSSTLIGGGGGGGGGGGERRCALPREKWKLSMP